MANTSFDNPFIYTEYFIPDTELKTAEELDATMPCLPDVCGMRTYAEGKLLGIYQSALADAVESGAVPVGRQAQLCSRPSRALVTNSWLKRLECYRHNDSQSVFYLDAVMVAEIDLLGSSGERHHTRQWYRIRGEIDFHGSRLNPVQSILIYDKKDRRSEPSLTEWLIPVLAKRDMDAEASRILEKYGFGHTVSGSGKLDARKLAEKMQLRIIPARLSPNGSIRGELFLHDGSVCTYSKGTDSTEMEVSAGTILYDPSACKTQAGIQETIVHECLHYELHWLFYSLQREYTDTIRFLSCMDGRYAAFGPEDTYQQWMDDQSYESVFPGQQRDGTSRTAMEWAEWQVRELTPRLMMPEEQTRRKITELTARLRRSPDEPLSTVYSRVIPALGAYYSVSWTMAKIRMLELGFEEARGALCYADGAYLPPYTASGSVLPGVTYHITRADGMRLYSCDLGFRAAVDSGLFRYVEGHFCLNHPQFLCKTASGVKLTSYARTHVEQCCMQFHQGYRTPIRRHSIQTPHSDTPASDPIALALSALPFEAFQCMSERLSADCSKLPRELGPTLVYHRKSKGLTQDRLAELLGVDTRTIRRMETGQEDSPSPQAVACIGVMLGLPGVYTEDMLNKAGHPLLRDTKADMELKFVIHFMYTRPMEEINQILTSHGCRPLEIGRRQKSISA